MNNFIKIPDGRFSEFKEKMADFVMSKYTADFHLMELIKKFRSLDIGDNILKEKWGENYGNNIEKLNEFFKFCSMLPVYFIGYDRGVDDFFSSTKDFFNPKFKKGLKVYIKCCKCNDIGYEAYSILHNSSSLKGFVLPNETLFRKGIYRFKSKRDKERENYSEVAVSL